MTQAPALPQVGDRASLSVGITSALVDRFVALTGDDNPIHMDDAAAKVLGLPERVVHGMCYASFVSTLIGTKLPGAGALWASQTYRFLAPVHIGDCITLSGEVIEVATRRKAIRLHVQAVNKAGREVMEGESEVLLPGAGSAECAASRSRHVARQDSQRVAFVAGAGGALGRVIATRLAEDGFAVALAGRKMSPLQALAEERETVIAVNADLSDGSSVREAVAETELTLGAPSLVVHCASALLPNAGPSETDWEVYRKHFEIQVGGLHRLLLSAAPAMEAAGAGQFILIGSTASSGPPPKGMAAYAGAKSAAGSLIRSIAAEMGPKGIRANIISPHFMNTPLTATVPSKMRKLVAAQTPLRRLAELSEVAAAVAFLAGSECQFVNGHELVLDGGATMR